MPIRFINPNRKSYLNGENEVFLSDGFSHRENSTPEYEKMFIYAELIAVRPTNTVLVSNDSTNELNQTDTESLTVNFVGYDQEGSNDGYHTTYCGYKGRGSDSEVQYNGFGIKSIDVSVTRNSITKVDIEFIDANKGSSLGKSPYDILLSKVPQPYYILKLKGYYGRTLTYSLLMHKIPTITMDNDGSMLIKAEFYSNVWKILGDLMVNEIFQVPFLPISNNNNQKFNINNNEQPKSFYEFIVRGRRFYSELIDLKNTESSTEELTILKNSLSSLKRLNNYKDNYINQLPDVLTKDNLYNITKNFTNQERKYVFILNRDNIFSDLQNILQTNYEEFILSFDPEFINQLNISDFDIIDLDEVAENTYELDFSVFENILKQNHEDTTNQIGGINQVLEDEINDLLNQNFGNGFKPTIRNIFKLLCDDVDRFMNILRDTSIKAENYHKNNTPLVDNGSGGVDIVQSFPVYSKLEKSQNNVNRLVKRFPSDKPDWFETKLVEQFFDASIYQRIVESEDDSRGKRKIENILTDERINEVKENTQFSIIKEEIYYRFKRYVDKYIKGIPNNSQQFSYPFNNGTALIDKFTFIDRAFNDIGDECILDFIPILDMDLSNTTVISMMDEILSINNFSQFRLENFMLHTQNTWLEAFDTLDNINQDSTPNFICQYQGSTSEYLQEDLDDSFSISNDTELPPDYNNDNDIFAFKVDYGVQNQSYFKDIQLSTAEHANTIESFRLADDISNLGGKTVPALQGQSLYNIYENYSYSATITMMGCMMIQPMQYFELCHIPLFSGTYMVQEVKHQLTSDNDMVTIFNGIRVGRYVKPIVNEFAKSVDVLFNSIKDDYNDSFDKTLDERKRALVLIRNESSRYTDNNDFDELYGIEEINDYFNIENNILTIDLGYVTTSFSTINNNNLFTFNNDIENEFI